MSGMSTDAKHAILNTERGMNIDTFRSATELAEQAMRSAMWEMKPVEHVAWAERMVEMVRAHRDVQGPPTAPTDTEIIDWADGFIRKQAFNRGVAVQIATEAAKWVRARLGAGASPASHEDDIEAVIACLGDDAAGLRDENQEDERAANMDVAAATIRSLCKQLDEARTAGVPDTPAEPSDDELHGMATAAGLVVSDAAPNVIGPRALRQIVAFARGVEADRGREHG